MNKFIQIKQEEWKNKIDFFKKEISTLRTGRANPAILSGIYVSVYGAKSALSAVANISVNDGSSLTIAPWDKKLLKEIEKSLVEADLGVGVSNEGERIRISIPQMTEENRRDLVKKLNEKQEKARISVRQVRDEVKSFIEKAFEEKEIAEDEKFRYLRDLDEKINELNEEIKKIRDEKEEEIMKI